MLRVARGPPSESRADSARITWLYKSYSDRKLSQKKLVDLRLHFLAQSAKTGQTGSPDHVGRRFIRCRAATLGGDVLRPAVVMAIVEGLLAELAPKPTAANLDRVRGELRETERAVENLRDPA